MTVRPVISRELRVASRQAATWRLRLAFAVAALLALGFGFFWPGFSPPERGMIMLICATVAAFALSLLTGSYLTADSVSREKRAGTLGLLFLTPLNGPGIVVGKFVCHSTQVFYAWLAMLPCFFLPVLHGGVLGSEVARILLALLFTLLLSLAVGLFWSTVCTEARTSVMASAVSMLLLTFLPWLLFFLSATLGRSPSTGNPTWSCVLSPMTSIITAFEGSFSWRGRSGLPSGAELYWTSLSLCLLLGLGLIVLSGWLLPRLWRRAAARGSDIAPVPRRKTRTAATGQVTARRFPIFVSPADWLATRGGREPVWLRVLRWATVLFFAALLLYSVTDDDREGVFVVAFCVAYVLHFVARIQGVMTATRSLFEDRRSGALELLLVTPAPESDLIQAHHAAVRKSLAPLCRTILLMNIALQLAVTLGASRLGTDDEVWWIFTALFTGGFVLTLSDFRTLRWIGARQALRATTHLRAAGATFAWLMGPPWLGFAVMFPLATQFSNAAAASVLFYVWIAVCLLYNDLWVRGCRRWLRAGIRRRVAEAN